MPRVSATPAPAGPPQHDDQSPQLASSAGAHGYDHLAIRFPEPGRGFPEKAAPPGLNGRGLAGRTEVCAAVDASSAGGVPCAPGPAGQADDDKCHGGEQHGHSRKDRRAPPGARRSWQSRQHAAAATPRHAQRVDGQEPGSRLSVPVPRPCHRAIGQHRSPASARPARRDRRAGRGAGSSIRRSAVRQRRPSPGQPER